MHFPMIIHADKRPPEYRTDEDPDQKVRVEVLDPWLKKLARELVQIKNTTDMGRKDDQSNLTPSTMLITENSQHR